MFFYEFFFLYINYYQTTKKSFKKNRVEDQNLSEEEKEKRVSIIVHVIGIFLRKQKKKQE